MNKAKRNDVREPLVHLSKRASIDPLKAWAIRLAAIALGLIICGLVAFLLIEKLNQNPGRIGDFYEAFIKGSFSTNRKLWKFLKNVAILLCVSLALTPAFRMRFWNIGGEGQTLVSVLGAIAVDFYLGGKVPEWLLLILMLLAALLSGAVWGVIPAIFRAKWGTNETLFTLMMNYVATFLVGYFLVIYYAGIMGISRDLYESSAVDGASPWQQFWGITIPMLKPITYLVVTLGIIWSFQVFDLSYLMTGGGPGKATVTLVMSIYNSAFKQYRMGYACAQAVFLLLVVVVVNVLEDKILGRGEA